ncbi:23S rRNA (guanosine(2251)-2'-O)-methyltransferase RlmB [Borrelia miyamotoi]|uniref:23S rRNA (Guanosine(2251)-2'-O)-methyltransferase RlmB n=1 Tax=Borrelia miyamotoi TaxID=47466 RepID=A0AAX3JM76_9SPIR|nr:23S rRNA (guanosine(2251)-2'-O)-methyltransferase RlmB [Borrelia miyamotoi]QFP41833.1 23S rRNA (guanosine(2251)-2'-O)-methyltransferase RlmB [Borrelia miyamotoi]QFP47953.1 23S rRNA (guanosine(2251)-2'-O)-methyltransferase RlmB [Borrelia miyamotoi]QGT55712.1 23S rRNA (guanosine(2251)-2'-O)-methyltransferase RlmB [Borrelia miyamotoi]QGT56494.1 23S rRNA (guanosine(2251)-2'-O)-methyltransferase RlmB [Borrelia miyamotoi]WAZ71740.1 23S rRNA (guanosine(2251)-2'-O)-methyltransferase RlmB [Borrelia 
MYITHANSIIESIKNNKGLELYISKTSPKSTNIEKLAKKYNLKIIKINDLAKVIKTNNHRGFALKIIAPKSNNTKKQDKSLEEYLEEFEHKNNVFILILDGIEDPQNFGAILRTSEQFRIDLVITSHKRSVKDNSTILRTSSGASQYVNKLIVSNINNIIKQLKKNGFWIYASDIKGEAVNAIKINNNKIVLIMGNEGKGIHKLIKENSDFLIKIPTRGKIDSLNVSVSTGILIFEIKRQLNLL